MWLLFNGSHSFMEHVLQILLLFGRTLDQRVGTYFVSQLLPFGRCYEFFRIRHSEVTFGACKKKKENKQRYWFECVNGGDEAKNRNAK